MLLITERTRLRTIVDTKPRSRLSRFYEQTAEPPSSALFSYHIDWLMFATNGIIILKLADILHHFWARIFSGIASDNYWHALPQRFLIQIDSVVAMFATDLSSETSRNNANGDICCATQISWNVCMNWEFRARLTQIIAIRHLVQHTNRRQTRARHR